MDGFAIQLTMAETQGFSFFTTLGHTRARVFGPENGGIILDAGNLSDVIVQKVGMTRRYRARPTFSIVAKAPALAFFLVAIRQRNRLGRRSRTWPAYSRLTPISSK